MKSKRKDKQLVDLGAATIETKGGPVGREDQNLTFIPAFGLISD